MKVGIYNRWLATMGGGERHMLAIAQSLQRRHQVEVITHQPVDKAVLESKLHLDLSGVIVRAVPRTSVDQLSALTARYDLFINASHMSLLPARAAHNMMLVYFPTPISLSPWGKFKRWVGLWLQKRLLLPDYVDGFYDPERTLHGVYRRLGMYGCVHIPAVRSGVLPLTVTVGLPGDIMQATVRCLVNDSPAGEWLLDADGPWQSFPLVAHTGADKTVRLDLQINAQLDSQTAGRAELSEPTLWLAVRPQQRRYHLYEQVFERALPELGLRLLAIPPQPLESYLDTYDLICANSEFTRGWIGRYWRRDSAVLYPLVDVEAFAPLPKRDQIISVGRFFAGGHNKKHPVMVRAFKQMIDQGLTGWTLHLAGGTMPGEVHQQYFDHVRAEAAGYPIEIHADLPFHDLVRLYGESKIYWHASGYGENVNKNPILFEHFGITTVEAMAAGCVPVVIGKAGQVEVVHHGTDGYLWQTLDELVAQTQQLIDDEPLRQRLAALALERSHAFGAETFERQLQSLLRRIGAC